MVNVKVEKVDKTKSGVSVNVTDGDGKKQTLEAEKILIAVGRAPNTSNVGLEKTKIKADRGFITTNEWMQTEEPGIYAAGDIIAGFPQLAHVGFMQGIVAVGKIAGKTVKPLNRNHIPGCTYCEPQIASVGLTEAAAKQAGHKVKIGKFPFLGNSKASILGQHDGFIKVVADEKYGEILGVHIIGPLATELISEAVTAMELEATVEDLMFMIHAHPTVYEAMSDAANSVYGIPINV
jgi:dihydrolipoyl dehydrogenase